MSEETPTPASLRIVSGEPTAVELAVLTALVSAAAGAATRPERQTRGRWNDPFDQHRRPWLPGAGAWRASLR